MANKWVPPDFMLDVCDFTPNEKLCRTAVEEVHPEAVNIGGSDYPVIVDKHTGETLGKAWTSEDAWFDALCKIRRDKRYHKDQQAEWIKSLNQIDKKPNI